LELVIVGDGRYRPTLEELARQLGVAARVRFRGLLPAGAAVQSELDAADVFVLPSRTEGLPRAMIEAMARGLPCIGSAVGGIPELLPIEAMVPAGDVNELAHAIRTLASNPEWMARMSARNVRIAREYEGTLLRDRRTMFLRRVRTVTREWQCNRSV
jgi:glycosyltransferase involved in cell wall biosynthesis